MKPDIPAGTAEVNRHASVHISMIRLIPLLFVFVLISSCGVKQKKFDKEGWNEMDDFLYANRESMVKDLMDNYLYKGMTFQELTRLIGPPENYASGDPNTIAYEIMVDYGWNIDPVAGKTLFMELSSDSTLINYRLENWRR